jgi:hypothetical protein
MVKRQSEHWLADETGGNVHTIVVGMHDALPDSISTGHSMNESAQMETSGRRIDQDLLAFRSEDQQIRLCACQPLALSHRGCLQRRLSSKTGNSIAWLDNRNCGSNPLPSSRKSRRSKASGNGRLRISAWTRTIERRNSFCLPGSAACEYSSTAQGTIWKAGASVFRGKQVDICSVRA